MTPAPGTMPTFSEDKLGRPMQNEPMTVQDLMSQLSLYSPTTKVVLLFGDLDVTAVHSVQLHTFPANRMTPEDDDSYAGETCVMLSDGFIAG